MRDWLATNWISIGVAVVAGSLGAIGSTLWLRPAAPVIEVRPLDPQPTAVMSIWVHVDGAVVFPGVYELTSDSRVFDAIDMAGGATEAAELSSLNLAARVTDGQKLVVPAQGQATVAGTNVASPSIASASPTDPRINLNTATQKMLESLPGIGAVTAQRIVLYRQANGPFKRIEDVRDTKLVTSAVFERIKTLITVG
ncbi:MAG TPA: ComEA family DNA-binding protein [Chloroflexota bacterium]|jgi:competence protein ComEA